MAHPDARRARQYRRALAAAATLVLSVGCTRPTTVAVVNPDAVDLISAAEGDQPPLGAGLATATGEPPTPTVPSVATVMATPPHPLSLAAGFAAGMFVEGVPGIRMMAVAANGDVLATVPGEDRVVVLPDRNSDGAADSVGVFAEAAGLNEPHGIAIRGEWLYVANTDSVVRFPYVPGDLEARHPAEVVVASLPGGPQHWTRTLAFSADERMLVSVGSSCDVCEEDNPSRATVLRFDPDGSNGAIVARGLRNAVGLAVDPHSEAVWMTENGRDLLGDDLPPDELNLLREGANYGWPYCFGNRVPDPQLGGTATVCASTEPPAVELPAHSAPLGLSFYDATAFPEEYRGNLFVAYHGSWNRSKPTGYKVVRIPFVDGRPAGPPEDFAWGWLQSDTSRWGRPVDVKTAADGSLLVSDDFAGRVFRIAFAPVVPTPTPWR